MEFDFLASRSIKLYTLSCWIEGECRWQAGNSPSRSLSWQAKSRWREVA